MLKQTNAGLSVWIGIWLDAGGIKAPGAKPATEIAHGNLETPAWRFADQGAEGNEQTISLNIKIPEDMDRTVASYLCVGWSTTTADPGDSSKKVEWQLEYFYTKVDESTIVGAEATLYAVGIASVVAEGMVNTPFGVLALPHADDICLHCRLKRLSSASAGSQADNIADDIELHGIVLMYVKNKHGMAT